MHSSLRTFLMAVVLVAAAPALAADADWGLSVSARVFPRVEQASFERVSGMLAGGFDVRDVAAVWRQFISSRNPPPAELPGLVIEVSRSAIERSAQRLQSCRAPLSIAQGEERERCERLQQTDEALRSNIFAIARELHGSALEALGKL